MKKTLTLCFIIITIYTSSIAQIKPTVQFTNNTSCSEPNGWAIATVAGMTEGYRFQWRDLAGWVIADGPNAIFNLEMGNYMVTAIDLSTNLSASTDFILMDDVVMPSISITSVPNTMCNEGVSNGQLTVTINNGNASDHHIQWYSGPDESVAIANGVNPTLSSIAEGAYTVRVENIISGCTATASANVLRTQAAPGLSITPVVNTNCGGSPNGTLTANTSLEGQFAYEWYAGAAISGDMLANTKTLGNVAQGIYTVKATDMNTGCVDIATADLAEDCSVIVVETSARTGCTIPNGSASISVSGVTEGFIFQLYQGTDTSGPGTVTDATISSMDAGTYSVKVVKQSDLSLVGIVQFSILEDLVYPVVTVAAINNTNCAALPNGELTASIENADEYSFTWYAGTTTTGNVLGTASTLMHRPSGNYTVKVTDPSNACETLITSEILDDILLPVVHATIVNNTSCTLPDGALFLNVESPASDYTIKWFEGTGEFGALLGTQPTLENISAGTYTALITDEATACTTLLNLQVDEECLVTGNQKNNEVGIVYYPNPAKTALIIPSDVNTIISLVDVRGTVLLTRNIAPSPDPFTLDLSAVKSGRYVLRVTQAAKTTSHHIVIEK